MEKKEPTPEELRSAVATVLEHTEEWRFETNDGIYPPDNYCSCCGWSSRRDQKAYLDGLQHKEGCEFAAALRLLEAFSGAGVR